VGREGSDYGGFFIFIFFKNVFYRNIFLVSHFTVLYPYRPVGGGRDLHVNKHKFFCAEAPGGSLPPGGGAAGSPPARQGGGRLPPPNIKLVLVLKVATNLVSKHLGLINLIQ